MLPARFLFLTAHLAAVLTVIFDVDKYTASLSSTDPGDPPSLPSRQSGYDVTITDKSDPGYASNLALQGSFNSDKTAWVQATAVV